MIVTKEDLASGKYLILPPGWMSFGGVQKALVALVQRARRLPPWAQPTWMFAAGADTERGVIIHCVPDPTDSNYRSPGAAVMVKADAETLEFILEETQVDYDVVERSSGKTVAQVRIGGADAEPRPGDGEAAPR